MYRKFVVGSSDGAKAITKIISSGNKKNRNAIFILNPTIDAWLFLFTQGTAEHLTVNKCESSQPLLNLGLFSDVALMRNSAWSEATLPLLAAQCEADLIQATLEWEETTSEDGVARFEPPFHLGEILNCQHRCERGRGFCNNNGDCVCFAGFRGRGCEQRAGEIIHAWFQCFEAIEIHKLKLTCSNFS